MLPEVAAEGLIGSMREGGSKTGGGGGWEGRKGEGGGSSAGKASWASKKLHGQRRIFCLIRGSKGTFSSQIWTSR